MFLYYRFVASLMVTLDCSRKILPLLVKIDLKYLVYI